MNSTRLLNVTSIILTILNLFIIYTTFFTNIFNDSTFSFWYWPGAILIFITLIIHLTILPKSKYKLVVILSSILNLILLILFSAPILLV